MLEFIIVIVSIVLAVAFINYLENRRERRGRGKAERPSLNVVKKETNKKVQRP